ncbi:MAG: hypothetical protein JRD68_12960 [Deltaproteobacteria bacterium]|nr:hypothetical protein [Deltaproteobacteria bacterium]
MLEAEHTFGNYYNPGLTVVMMVVVLPEIPVEVSANRLAAKADLPVEETAGFLRKARAILRPAGIFDEVDPTEVLGRTETGWGPTVIIGLCTLGLEASGSIRKSSGRPDLWGSFSRIALKDTLDYLEYRVRLFLRPTGRDPGDRLIPGCQELPLEANRMIWDHFKPDKALGFQLQPSGEIDNRAGFAFLYTTAERAENEPSRCDNCSRKDCPAKL